MSGDREVWVGEYYCFGCHDETVIYHTHPECPEMKRELEQRMSSWLYTQFENQEKCKKCQRLIDGEKIERQITEALSDD